MFDKKTMMRQNEEISGGSHCGKATLIEGEYTILRWEKEVAKCYGTRWEKYLRVFIRISILKQNNLFFKINGTEHTISSKRRWYGEKNILPFAPSSICLIWNIGQFASSEIPTVMIWLFLNNINNVCSSTATNRTVQCSIPQSESSFSEKTDTKQ